MASRRFDILKVLGLGRVEIVGSFAPNGSSAVSSASNKGKGFSVARANAGDFTITFDDKYADMVSATATLQLATAADQYVQVGAYDASAKTLKLYVWDVSGAALADVAANANNRINFRVVFRNTSVNF